MENNDFSDINVFAVKRMVETDGWKEFVGQTKLMIEDLRDMLEHGNEDDERIRGRIDAIRTLIAWPDSVMDSCQLAPMEEFLTEDDLDGRD